MPAYLGRRCGPVFVLAAIALLAIAGGGEAQVAPPTAVEQPAVEAPPPEDATLPKSESSNDENARQTGAHIKFSPTGIDYGGAYMPSPGPGEYVIFDPDLRLTGRMGMRLGVDAAAYATSSSDLSNISDAIEVRRFFLYTTGELHFAMPVEYGVDLGVKENRFFVDKFFLSLRDLPVVGTFKIGVFTAPMSLADLSSGDGAPLMEDPAPVDAFAPGTKAGLQISDTNADQRLTGTIGWFADAQENDVGDDTKSFSRGVTRVTWLPYLETGDELQLIHLGLSTSHVLSSGEDVHYRSRPESFLAPNLVNTDVVAAKNALIFGAEAAFVRGPFSIQSEYLGSFVASSAIGDPVFGGAYVMASYFLTGETRPYDRSGALFGRVTPLQPFALSPFRSGAWEIAARYSALDLSSGEVDGGRMRIVMTGVNWYWNRYVRWMLEYGHANIHGGSSPGALNIFQLRFQVRI